MLGAFKASGTKYRQTVVIKATLDGLRISRRLTRVSPSKKPIILEPPKAIIDLVSASRTRSLPLDSKFYSLPMLLEINSARYLLSNLT